MPHKGFIRIALQLRNRCVFLAAYRQIDLFHFSETVYFHSPVPAIFVFQISKYRICHHDILSLINTDLSYSFFSIFRLPYSSP